MIGITDDQELNRRSLAEKLTLSGVFEVVLLAENGASFLEQMGHLAKEKQPQAVLMDIEMPLMNGVEAVRRGKEAYPDVHFLMLTVFDEDDKITEALQAGAAGYLLKDESISQISQVIQDVIARGGAYLSPKVAKQVVNMLNDKTQRKSHMTDEASPVSPGRNANNLSPRELEILHLLAKGCEIQEIGRLLYISPNTARNHVANIYAKLGVSNKVEAVMLALKKGWVD